MDELNSYKRSFKMRSDKLDELVGLLSLHDDENLTDDYFSVEINFMYHYDSDSDNQAED